MTLKRFFTSIRQLETLLPVLLILAFATTNIASVLREFSLTTDEDKHYAYGEKIVSGDSTRFDDSKMPVSGLNALPKKLASFLDGGKLKQVLSRFYVARTVTIIFSCLLAFLVFHWARLRYGFVPALFSLCLYVLDPNVIAHSQLVTTDLYVTLAITFAFYALWRFSNERNWANGLVCLLALGVSQITKYTAVALFPLFILILLIYDFPAWRSAFIGLKVSNLLKRYTLYGVYTILVTLLIINLGFLFNHTFTAFGDYRFSSATFNKIQAKFSFLHSFPVPVPYPYLQGFDLMINTEKTGNFSGNVYLLGKISTLDGFPGYYFIASLLKVPLATQAILLFAFISYFTRQERRINFRINEMFLLIPVLFFAVYFNFFFNTQIGIRYYLPVFPLLYIFAGSLFVGWGNFSLLKKLSSLAAIA